MKKQLLKRYLPYLIPAVIITGAVLAFGNEGMLLILLIFLLGTLFNRLLGKYNRDEVVSEYLFFHSDKGMRYIRLITATLLILYNSYALYYVSMYAITLHLWPVLLVTHIIINSNFGMSLAHDMMHAPHRPDRVLASVMLIQNGFFYLEYDHLYIHHRHVATAHDPASATTGKSLYAYLPFSLSARLRHIFSRQASSATERHYLLRVRVLLAAALLWLGIALFAGIHVFALILTQYIAVILIYETVTYIQHYGLSRQRINSSDYERVNLGHSWNSYYKYSNYLYFFMPVHALHHAGRAELSLQEFESSPEMPLPFPQMLMLAFFPARWFNKMHPLLRHYHAPHQLEH